MHTRRERSTRLRQVRGCYTIEDEFAELVAPLCKITARAHFAARFAAALRRTA